MNTEEPVGTERYANVWDAVEATPGAAENMRIRSALMQEPSSPALRGHATSHLGPEARQDRPVQHRHPCEHAHRRGAPPRHPCPRSKLRPEPTGSWGCPGSTDKFAAGPSGGSANSGTYWSAIFALLVVPVLGEPFQVRDSHEPRRGLPPWRGPPHLAAMTLPVRLAHGTIGTMTPLTEDDHAASPTGQIG
jgi:hypothetical protein